MPIAPLFTSAPRVKIKIGSMDVAYAIGLNLNVSIDVQPIYICGKFEPSSLEPTMYNPVTGTIQILRLKSPTSVQLKSGLDTDTITNIETLKTGKLKAGEVVEPAVLAQSDYFTFFDPRTILLSTSFDLDFYIRYPIKIERTTTVTAGEATVVNGISTTEYTSEIVDNYINSDTEEAWLRIKDVRFISRNTNITLGQLVNEPINFQGLFMTSMDGTSELMSTDKWTTQ